VGAGTVAALQGGAQDPGRDAIAETTGAGSGAAAAAVPKHRRQLKSGKTMAAPSTPSTSGTTPMTRSIIPSMSSRPSTVRRCQQKRLKCIGERR